MILLSQHMHTQHVLNVGKNMQHINVACVPLTFACRSTEKLKEYEKTCCNPAWVSSSISAQIDGLQGLTELQVCQRGEALQGYLFYEDSRVSGSEHAAEAEVNDFCVCAAAQK